MFSNRKKISEEFIKESGTSQDKKMRNASPIGDR
jgi:hypothetical protein